MREVRVADELRQHFTLVTRSRSPCKQKKEGGKGCFHDEGKSHHSHSEGSCPEGALVTYAFMEILNQ